MPSGWESRPSPAAMEVGDSIARQERGWGNGGGAAGERSAVTGRVRLRVRDNYMKKQFHITIFSLFLVYIFSDLGFSG